MIRALILSVMLAGAGLSAPAMAQRAASPECRAPMVQIGDGAGQGVDFRVEIADTPALRAQGLMFRTELPEQAGMLFVYEQPQHASFWMKNTLIPLDMIFMDSDGVVRHIHRGAVPGDLTPVPGAVPGDPQPLRRFVLEIAAGEADRLGLAVGQRMTYPYIPAGHENLPACAA